MQRRDSNAASLAGSRGRRMSKFVPSRTALHAGSEDSSAQRPPTRRYENTYRTDPDPGGEFSTSAVQGVVTDILHSTLDTIRKYDAVEAARLVVRLTSIIKQAVKEMQFPRFKLVVNVLLGENRNQGFQMASRCIWNEHLDNYSSAEYKSDVLWSVVTVHGIYYE